MKKGRSQRTVIVLMIRSPDHVAWMHTIEITSDRGVEAQIYRQK
jgi:hypothetical protein